jgi:hypothetical protein
VSSLGLSSGGGWRVTCCPSGETRHQGVGGTGVGERSTVEGSTSRVLDMGLLEAELPQLRDRYRAATPFPHIVLDNFLLDDVAERAVAEFAEVDGRWLNYVHMNERKFANREPASWGATLRQVLAELNSPAFVDFVGALTGIDRLVADDSLEGGGLHRSLAGGFLNIHADFTVHPKRREWRRRVNLLLYLNADWPAEYGGSLELWSKDMKRREQAIAPSANRAVIFTTDPDSFHGHPDPLRCPPGVARQSMALYYFTAEHDPVVRSTEYRARPRERLRALPI